MLNFKQTIKTNIKSWQDVISSLAELKNSLPAKQQDIIENAIEAIFVKTIQEINVHQTLAILGVDLPLHITDEDVCEKFMTACRFSITETLSVADDFENTKSFWPKHLKKQIQEKIDTNDHIRKAYEKVLEKVTEQVLKDAECDCKCSETHN